MIKKIALIILLVASVLWLGFIFSNSLQTASESSDKSSSVTQIVNDVAQAVGIEQEIPEKTVRDMAHFSEFAFLAVLICADIAVLLTFSVCRTLYMRSLTIFASLPVCFLLACVDELLQKFSAGRASDFADVLLDTLGALCGVAASLVIYIIIDIVISKRAKKQSDNK